MTRDEMVDVVHRHLDAEARHDAQAAASTYTADGVYEHQALGLRFEGRDAVAAQYAASYQSIPDLQASYDLEIVGVDTVVQVGRFRGRVAGEFLGVPAAGDVDLPIVAVNRFRDGAMAGEQVWFDLDELCRQLHLDRADVDRAIDALRGALTATG